MPWDLGSRHRRFIRLRAPTPENATGGSATAAATARANVQIAYLLISNRDKQFCDLGAGYYDRPCRRTS